jgi:hypothetical protein
MNKMRKTRASLHSAEGSGRSDSYNIRRRFLAAASSAVIACLGCGLSLAVAQTAGDATPKADSQLPPVTVTAPEPKRRAGNAPSRRAERGTQKPKPQAARREIQPQPTIQESGADSSSTITAGNAGPASKQVLSLGKTGTKLEDMPVSVQIVPREILNQQGVTVLRDA